eukprot:3941217-Rhodomonas_salina.11
MSVAGIAKPASASAVRCELQRVSNPLPPYKFPTQSPVLTYVMPPITLHIPYAKSGTDIEHAATRSSSSLAVAQVSASVMALSAGAMSGTDIAHAAVSSCTCAVRCAVLA